MKIKNFLFALFLTILVLLLSYFSSKSIEQMIKEKEQRETQIPINKNSSTNSSIVVISEENIENASSKFTNKSRNLTSNLSVEHLRSILIDERNVENKSVSINYTKFEEAYVYDFCYAKEVLSIEGRNLICINEVPKIIRVNLSDNIIKIVYNDMLIRDEVRNKEILLGYAFAKDFYGVEGEIIEFFTNSTFAYIKNFELGEISYFNETIIYAMFPIYIDVEKMRNEQIDIFVRTSIKNYLISSIIFLLS